MMFLIEITNENLLLGFIPESLALLLFGIFLIGGAVIAGRILKHQAKGKRTQVN